MSPSLTPNERRKRLERIALLSAAVAGSALASTGAHATTECQPWNASIAYVAGDTVTEAGQTYKANWWTQGNDPAANNGPTGSGEPWTVTTSCGASPPPAPTPPSPPPAPTPPSPPPAPAPAGFVFGSYKDVTINMDWNVDQISTSVTGTRSPILNVLPARQTSVSWAFASGECGSETWGGVTPAALVAQNVSQWVGANKKYIISTGGANGVFSCGSDANFEKFIQTYNSASLQGIDFDIEGGQSQDIIDNLVARVKTAQGNHPNLRFSFTLATLGGNAAQSLGAIGVNVMSSIKAAGLSNYIVNLMTMDYGSAIASNCTLGSNGKCDMGQSAINAAINLHNFYGVPYAQIELTPMIGGNDATDETFTLANVDTVSSWALANHLAGIHFWSLDRDTDCAPGSASATCNSYGAAGNFGFANRFIGDLGL